MSLSKRLICFAILIFLLRPVSAFSKPADEVFVEKVLELAKPLLHDSDKFGFQVKALIPASQGINEPRVKSGSDRRIAAELRMVRSGPHEWSLHLFSGWREILLCRTASQTQLFVPKRRIIFSGSGQIASEKDSLEPTGILNRMITIDTAIFPFLSLFGPETIKLGLQKLILPRMIPLPPSPGFPESLFWELPGGETLEISASGTPFIRLEVASQSNGLKGMKFFELSTIEDPCLETIATSADAHIREVSRTDLEKMIFRGLRRILSIKFPGPGVLNAFSPNQIPNGEISQQEHHMVVRLSGTPEEIGTAHGKLLGSSIERMIDSTIYLVGLVESIEKGSWFLDDLEEAWNRVSPHIPQRHILEMMAIASACPQISWREARLSNIFPEYFHCSGFAVFGKASKDGILYHGRVLDYMTEIGLQHAAATFIVRPQGLNGFLNVGYAGFVGSVTGMNEKQISLGEMGGGGRFHWDGVPMATLMRRALEECNSLEEVKTLWASSPRTCEYYYVFADGKIPDAVACKATSRNIEFLPPGRSHLLLGDGIPDSVALSGGKRLTLLRQRILENHGKIDPDVAIRLMDRPVAMKSNLHNALFVPQKLEAYIAHSENGGPAANSHYVKYDLKILLQNMPP